MRAVDLINHKRIGATHAPGQIAALIASYLHGDIPDYQIAAWLMAVCCHGLTTIETAELTNALVSSGRRLSSDQYLAPRSGLVTADPPVVDKHSTGGVGDTTTLVLIPMLAAAGCVVAKMSGRGLGHSGGTIDKLEAIPGVQTAMTSDAFVSAVRDHGMVIAAQSVDLAPGDGRLYALRDVTGTVESIPLIASSVMSKKIATGAQAVVLDVKVGSGAFMATLDEATQLAQAMVDLGKAAGLRVVAVLTAMDEPLGNAVGNLLEVREAIATLRGHGTAALRDICVVLGAEVMVAAGAVGTYAQAVDRLQATIDDGTALGRFRDLVVLLGGDGQMIDDPDRLPIAPFRHEVRATAPGWVTAIAARQVGEVAMRLGAGRATKDAEIDPAVGLVLHVQSGDVVRTGDVLATVHSGSPIELLPDAIPNLRAAFSWGDQAITPRPRVLLRVI